MKIPTIAEDPYHAPPWKVDAPVFGQGVWSVSTDRGGDLSEEYDLLENPPEWAVRLIAIAPELLSICETALSCGVLDVRSGPTTADIVRRIYTVQARLKDSPTA
jgi:hypothetical protein